MDIEKLINQMRFYGSELGATPLNNIIGKYMLQAATALSTLQAENEKLFADLVCVTAERDAAKSPEVLEAVDELVEFARTRMCTADWLYYANVLGEWRGLEKED